MALGPGLADAYTEIGPRSLALFRSWMHEAFAQDSWKVSDKLHLDYGIRWTLTQGYAALVGQ